MKMVKKMTCIYAVLIIAILLPSLSVNAQIESVSVTAVQQAKSNWCWAACAEMSGKVVYSSSTRTQYNVVNYLKGSLFVPYPNSTGSIEESASGSQYVAHNTKTFTSTDSKWIFPQIESSLADGYPVQAGAGYYTNGVRNGGHVVVIKKTESTNSNAYIDYVDPWDGATYHCSYLSFCDASFNGRKYDQTIYVEE